MAEARTLLAALLLAACSPAGGPEPIAFDREACAHCRMLISDPRFAAQLIPANGEPRSFDDPGCLLRWRRERAAAGQAWFHHLREERWLRETEVAFLGEQSTPMGYGLGAVDAGTPGALALAEAEARVEAFVEAERR